MKGLENVVFEFEPYVDVVDVIIQEMNNRTKSLKDLAQ